VCLVGFGCSLTISDADAADTIPARTRRRLGVGAG
jgi:hypothetical protein